MKSKKRRILEQRRKDRKLIYYNSHKESKYRAKHPRRKVKK